MATETVILRPNSSFIPIADVTINTSGVTNPPVADATQLWTLISEEISDEDSTYIKINSGSATIVLVRYGFHLPSEKYINTVPDKISLYIQAADKLDGNKHCLTVFFEDDNGSTIEQIQSTTILTSTYQTIKLECPKENLETIYRLLLDNKNGILRFDVYLPSGGSMGKNQDIRITQMYLELEYSDGGDEPTTSEIIHLKQNGSWSTINGDIYQKENGIWVLKDISVLQEGLKYKVNNV